jgi:hypothetical protein
MNPRMSEIAEDALGVLNTGRASSASMSRLKRASSPAARSR